MPKSRNIKEANNSLIKTKLKNRNLFKIVKIKTSISAQNLLISIRWELLQASKYS
jgi:hypothetical protein